MFVFFKIVFVVLLCCIGINLEYLNWVLLICCFLCVCLCKDCFLSVFVIGFLCYWPKVWIFLIWGGSEFFFLWVFRGFFVVELRTIEG